MRSWPSPHANQEHAPGSLPRGPGPGTSPAGRGLAAGAPGSAAPGERRTGVSAGPRGVQAAHRKAGAGPPGLPGRPQPVLSQARQTPRFPTDRESAGWGAPGRLFLADDTLGCAPADTVLQARTRLLSPEPGDAWCCCSSPFLPKSHTAARPTPPPVLPPRTGPGVRHRHALEVTRLTFT